MIKNNYTEIEGFGYCCNDCGAMGKTVETIHHYKTCEAREGEFWEKFYGFEDIDSVSSNNSEYEEYLNKS